MKQVMVKKSRIHSKFSFSQNILINYYNFIGHQFMRILHILKTFLLKLDCFGSNQMVRFKGEGKYQTLTGGVITFLLMILFGVIALQRFMSVVTKDTVNASDATYFLDDPTQSSLVIGDSKFIFGVGIDSYDLNGPLRYFDVSFSSTSYSNGSKVQQILYELQPCEEAQWTCINEIGLQKYLCPKPNQLIELGGKFTSESFKIQKIKVMKCNNATDRSRPCVADDVIKNASFRSYFNLKFYFMNAYVNSDTEVPVNYYLEDRNYFPFNINSTITSNIYLSEHIINTDNSLLPNQDIDTQSILLVKDLAQIKNTIATIDQYASVVLRKSSYYVESTRKFQKFDELFSYIGGLFGFAIVFFFLVNFYTEAAYEVQMGNRLFHYDSSEPLEPNKFNFLTYIGYCLFNAFTLIGLELPWDKMKQYSVCRQQTSSQLDLALFMNKITFLEKCMNILFEDHQFRTIYLQQKPTVEQAESLRLNHGLNKFIHRKSTTIKSIKLEKIKSNEAISKVKSKIDNHLNEETEKEKKNHSNEGEECFTQIQENLSEMPQDMLPIIKAFVLNQINNESDSGSSSVQPQSETISHKKSAQEQVGKSSKKQQFLNDVPESNLPCLRHINIVMRDIKRIKEESNEGNPISRRIYERLTSEVSEEKFLILKCLQSLGKKIITQRKMVQQSRQKSKELIRNRSQVKKLQSQMKEIIETGHEIALQTNDRLEKSGFM